MLRSRVLAPTIFIAALACGEPGSILAPAAGTPAPLPPSSAVTLVGTVGVSAAGGIRLSLPDDREFGLFGREAEPLIQFAGARVEVVGVPDGVAEHVLYVSQFRLLELPGGGGTVHDGTIERRGDDMVLRLVTGAVFEINAPPADLWALEGERVWLALDDDGRVKAHGRIYGAEAM